MIWTLENFILFAVITVVVNCQGYDQSCLTTKNIAKLKQVQTAAVRIPEDMKNASKQKDVVVFFGLVKSGRSTLVNYLIGNKLIAQVTRSAGLLNIALDKTYNSSGPRIGKKPKWETRIPTRWDSKKLPGFAIWDTPGFYEYRKVQDIENTFYNYELIKNVESVKIVLVISFDDLHNPNMNRFLTVFERFEGLFKKSMRDSLCKMSVIFTKVPRLDGILVDKEWIATILIQKFLTSSGMEVSEFAKECIEFLVENMQSFGLFRRPTKLGKISDASLDVDIIQAINSRVSLPTNSLGKISSLISSKSKSFLQVCREELVSEATFDDLKTIINCLFFDIDSKKHGYVGLKRIVENSVKIEDAIESFLRKSSSLFEMIDFVKKFDPKIRGEIRDDCLIEKADLLRFVERMLGLKESNRFEFGMRSLIMYMNDVVMERRQLVQSMLRGIEEQLKCKEERERLENIRNGRLRIF